MKYPSLKDLDLLSPSFLEQEDTLTLAKELLNVHLVHWVDGNPIGGRIVETEAYKAPEDPACHAHLNKRTKRTEVMFAKGGHAYVYLCYGIHNLLNIVTGPEGSAHAILIRAIEPIWGTTEIEKLRNVALKKNWTNGPGKLTHAMSIDRKLNGKYLFEQNSDLHLYKAKHILSEKDIMVSKRIGIDYAGEAKNWPWRFYNRQSPFVSKRLLDDKSFFQHNSN